MSPAGKAKRRCRVASFSFFIRTAALAKEKSGRIQLFIAKRLCDSLQKSIEKALEFSLAVVCLPVMCQTPLTTHVCLRGPAQKHRVLYTQAHTCLHCPLK